MIIFFAISLLFVFLLLGLLIYKGELFQTTNVDKLKYKEDFNKTKNQVKK
jgi:hypothetical protein